MAYVIWAKRAVEDLQDIIEYIAKDKPVTAELFRQKILSATKRLQLFPRMGRVVPEAANDEVREIIYGNYRIMYDYSETQVEITAIHHSARRFPIN